jgi:hypothetical protein
MIASSGCLMKFRDLLKVGLVGGLVLCLMVYWRHGLSDVAPASVAIIYIAGFVYFSIIHILLAGFDRIRGKSIAD